MKPLASLLLLLLFQAASAQDFATSGIFEPCSDCTGGINCAQGIIASPLAQKNRVAYVNGRGRDYDQDGFHDQWMDIYIPSGPIPAGGFPLVVYGHSSGSSPNSACSIALQAAQQGVAFVAWSTFNDDALLTDGSQDTLQAIQAGREDFVRVMLRLRKMMSNGFLSSFDDDRVYVMGRSRGATLSWRELDFVKKVDSNENLARGAILVQAFPTSDWGLSDRYPELENPFETVNGNYPPTYFVYAGNFGLLGDIHLPGLGLQTIEALRCLGVPYGMEYSVGARDELAIAYDPLFEAISDDDFELLCDGDIIDRQGSPDPYVGRMKITSVEYPGNGPGLYINMDQSQLNPQLTVMGMRCDFRLSLANENLPRACQEFVIPGPNSENSNGGPLSFSFRVPRSGQINLCDFGVLNGPVQLRAQASCRLAIDSLGTVIFANTPLSEAIEFTSPDCSNDFRSNELQVSTSSRQIDIRMTTTSDVQVIDMQGRVVWNRLKLPPGEYQIQVPSAGAYLVMSIQGDQLVKKTLVVD